MLIRWHKRWIRLLIPIMITHLSILVAPEQERREKIGIVKIQKNGLLWKIKLTQVLISLKLIFHNKTEIWKLAIKKLKIKTKLTKQNNHLRHPMSPKSQKNHLIDKKLKKWILVSSPMFSNSEIHKILPLFNSRLHKMVHNLVQRPNFN